MSATDPPQAPRRRCLDCSRPVSRPGALRCHACANRHKAGTFTPETARRAAIRRRDRGRENARLADLARALGLISDAY